VGRNVPLTKVTQEGKKAKNLLPVFALLCHALLIVTSQNV